MTQGPFGGVERAAPGGIDACSLARFPPRPVTVPGGHVKPGEDQVVPADEGHEGGK
ncbi:MAG: hypothetical protein KDD82_16130 [Planctomycetes bacterium]|nr:hypothetical protein [Planctomycetota bacterium]